MSGSATPILLVGAGGFAREALEIVRAVNAQAATWRVVGILDDDPGMAGRMVHDVEVIGPSEAVHDHPDARVALCIASPHRPTARLGVAMRLGLEPERYATLVHPSAVVPASAAIGHGTVLYPGTVLTADVALGAHVVAMPGVVLTHDDVVADGATLAAGARLAGGVTVEETAYVGSGALIREHVVVGAGSVVGMGAVVTRSVPAGEVWAGVPARRLRSVEALVAV